jgi:hypothetical protein
MAQSRTRKAIRRAMMSRTAWQNFLVLSASVLLFGAAMTATVANNQMLQTKGAWVTQAMR